MTIPHLPLELRVLIVEHLAADRDYTTLHKLRATNSIFAQITKPYVYHHVDLRNKSLSSISTFTQFIVPTYGPYIQSLSHRPVDEEQIEEIQQMGKRLELLRYWDDTYSRAIRGLNGVEAVDFTIPKLEFHTLYGNSMDVIRGWKGIKHMTIRSAGWGRGSFDSDTDAFNARTVASMLTDFPNIKTFRALGISGADISPDGPSLQALLKMPPLGLEALHLAGGWLSQFTIHFARLSPPLTHLILSEDALMEWIELEDLLLAVQPTLTSLAIRQAGALADDRAIPIVDPKLTLSKLKRLVLSMDGELLLLINNFEMCVNLETVEIGSDDGDFTRHLVATLEKEEVWPLLKEVAYVCPGVQSEDWSALHEVCEKRGAEFVPGFTTELDFPAR